MDVWLQRNQQCPACRIPINPSNPIRQIKGGLSQTEDIQEMSNANLRKARFDLLFREYEDEIDRLEAEVKHLKTENVALKSQITKDKGVVTEKTDFVHPAVSDTRLFLVTKKLQSAQNLYEELKEDLTKLKEENSKLRVENQNMKRTNEKLHMEIANRSPHRFGRHTVASLEKKIERYEKEIQQLNKALERSDKYVDELQLEMNKLKGAEMDKSSCVPPATADMLPDMYSDGKSVDLAPFNGNFFEHNHAKRQLFGSSLEDIRSLNSKSEKIAKPLVDVKRVLKSEACDESSLLLFEQSKDEDQSLSPAKDKSPKKVHFSLPNDSNSFDLDKPSPVSFPRTLQLGSSPGNNESKNLLIDQDSHPSHSFNASISKDCFDVENKNGKSVQKPNDQPAHNSSLSLLTMPDYNITQIKRREHANKLDMSDLDDTQTIRSELDDLNISLTPELSDCLKLLNRAEKKSQSCERTNTEAANNLGRDYSHDSHSTHSTTSTLSSVHPNESDHSILLRTVKSYPIKPLSGKISDTNSETSKTEPCFFQGYSQSSFYFSVPHSSSLPSSDPKPSSKAIPVSEFEGSGQSRGTKIVQDSDDKLLDMAISSRQRVGSRLSSCVPLASKTSSALKETQGDSSLVSLLTPVSCHMSATTGNPLSTKLILASKKFGHRCFSLDSGKEVNLYPLASLGNRNLLTSQTSGRKFSSLTTIPTVASASSVSSLSNYSRIVGSHLFKLNELNSSSISSQQNTPTSFSVSQPVSHHPSYSLSLTGNHLAVSTVDTSLPSEPLVASSSLSAGNPSKSGLSSAAYATSMGKAKMLYQSWMEHPKTTGEIENVGHYSYVSDTSNELSSRGFDSFLAEPKKRLFDSSDDLNVSLSPVKSSRIS